MFPGHGSKRSVIIFRHAYQRVDAEILWNIYAQGELATLREAVTAFIASLEANDQPSAKE